MPETGIDDVADYSSPGHDIDGEPGHTIPGSPAGVRESRTVTTEWLTELSTDRYLPMLRLLDDADLGFLRAQRGYTTEMESSLRRQRVQAFRGYLGLLEADFARAAAALQVIMAHSSYDRPELAFLVFQRRLTFAIALTGIHFQLLLFRFGFSGTDVSSVIRLFDGVRVELRTLVPDPSPLTA